MVKYENDGAHYTQASSLICLWPSTHIPRSFLKRFCVSRRHVTYSAASWKLDYNFLSVRGENQFSNPRDFLCVFLGINITQDVVMRRILKHIEDYQCQHKFGLMLLLDNFISQCEGEDFHKFDEIFS